MNVHFRNCPLEPCYCDFKRYCLVLSISLPILGLEVVGGVTSGSLALLSDAVHVFHDLLVVSLAILIEWLVRAKKKNSLVLRARGAYISALLLGVLALWIVGEAIHRFQSDYHVVSEAVIVIAAIGGIGNYIQHYVLDSHTGHDITYESVSIHVLSDFWQSVAVLLAGVLMAFTGWKIIDLVISVIIAIVFLFWSIRLFSRAYREQAQ